MSSNRGRVQEWKARKAAHAPDPLFDSPDTEAALTGERSAVASVGKLIIGRTNHAHTTDCGGRVWFPVQHLNREAFTPSAKRWR